MSRSRLARLRVLSGRETCRILQEHGFLEVRRRVGPIVQRQDQAQFGRYRTRDLILAYTNALTAVEVDTVVAL